MKAHPPLSFISFSCNKACYCICSQEATVSCCGYCAALRTAGSTSLTQKKHLSFRATWSTKAKNGFGTDHRIPLASASCLHSSIPQYGPAGGSCYKAPFLRNNTAQGLCQTHSVSQTVWLFHSSTAMARKQRDGPSVIHDNAICPTDGQRDRNTSVYMSRRAASICLCTLLELRGEGVYLLTAIRWISRRALKCPLQPLRRK